MDVMTKVLVLTVVALVIAVTLFGEIKPLRRLVRPAARVPRTENRTEIGTEIRTEIGTENRTGIRTASPAGGAVRTTGVVRTVGAGSPAARQAG